MSQIGRKERDLSSWRMDATDMLSAFREGRTTPPAILEECISRISRVNPALNAIVSLSPTAAADAEASAGQCHGKRAVRGKGVRHRK